ncbi:MAG: hypothetical protein LBP75_01415 [Planctomycetota bacterium]|jgi:hypothetical protein|nr:hypothetical protein [Planctomycetota bacterium]
MTYSVELIDPRALKLLEDLAGLRLIRVTATGEAADDDDAYCRELWAECAADRADEVVPLNDLAARLGVAL